MCSVHVHGQLKLHVGSLHLVQSAPQDLVAWDKKKKM